MKKLARFLVLLIGIAIVIYGWKNIPLESLRTNLKNTSIYIERNNKPFLEDWTNTKVLEAINSARESGGLSKLKVNEKLNQAASTRLSVIMTNSDYEGKITGQTREAVVKNSGYEANLIGDLVLLKFFKTNDPVNHWQSDNITRATLLHQDFKEMGIAIKNEQDMVSVYVVLVSPKKYVPTPKRYVWGGVELWSAVNKRRVELGVNPLKQRDELCTIASVRLNELLELGKLDGHAGFAPTLERPDLKWISEKYNISEFLAQGYATPQETVNAWENTLGHRALLAGGEYVWGCIYAQSSFAVAIAAY